MKQRTPAQAGNPRAPQSPLSLNADMSIAALDAATGMAWVIQQYVETTSDDHDLAGALAAHAAGLEQIRASVGIGSRMSP